jgi:hypothetical protein
MIRNKRPEGCYNNTGGQLLATNRSCIPMCSEVPVVLRAFSVMITLDANKNIVNPYQTMQIPDVLKITSPEVPLDIALWKIKTSTCAVPCNVIRYTRRRAIHLGYPRRLLLGRARTMALRWAPEATQGIWTPTDEYCTMFQGKDKPDLTTQFPRWTKGT